MSTDGQFEDAVQDQIALATDVDPVGPRDRFNYIDDANPDILEWSSTSEDEEDEHEKEEDELEFEAHDTLRAEDEDWEVAERDFTKQYNRLKQHVAVRTGVAHGALQSNTGNRSAVATLPAVNRPPPPKKTAADAKAQHARDKAENQLQALSKYSSRLRDLHMPYELGVGVNRKGPSATANQKDKSDRATSEQVLDPRTRIILFKMIGRGLLFEVNGCVSTGKEANVYHALTPDRKHLAIKIYKTSILVFKDRDRYVTGEHRFRRGYSRHNPRKMVRVWAEKEMRNLKRLGAAGIRSPEAVEVRENVLVMGFIGGNDGWASPRLKDAHIPPSYQSELYVELMLVVRKMFHECKLVHADLSEYNLIYHVESTGGGTDFGDLSQDPSEPTHDQSEERRGHLYVIDVSQSVEQDHPHAFDFLRADLKNVEDFFSKRGVKCLNLRRAFEFVTSTELKGGEGSPKDVLKWWLEEDVPDSEDHGKEDDAHKTNGESVTHEDQVFMRSYIPRTLNEVLNPERDVNALRRGETDKLIYKDTIGIVAPDKAEVKDTKVGEDNMIDMERLRLEAEGEDGDSGGDDGEDEESEDGEDGETGFKERKPRGHRHEDKDAKKERKKAVKEEAREKRKNKIPKAEKKRKIKVTARSGK